MQSRHGLPVALNLENSVIQTDACPRPAANKLVLAGLVGLVICFVCHLVCRLT
jgi:hypothetical protein